MYVECPECKSCFIIKDKSLPKAHIHFRCGVCKNVFLPDFKKGFTGSNLFWKVKILFRKFWKKVILALSLSAILFFCCTALWNTRDYLAQEYPAVKNTLALFGITGKSRISGLDFRNVQQKVVQENDNKVLEITGSIVNNRREDMEIPAVQAVILDDEGNKKESKVIYPKKRNLRPMESASFRIRILLMDADSDKAELNFMEQ